MEKSVSYPISVIPDWESGRTMHIWYRNRRKSGVQYEKRIVEFQIVDINIEFYYKLHYLIFIFFLFILIVLFEISTDEKNCSNF